MNFQFNLASPDLTKVINEAKIYAKNQLMENKKISSNEIGFIDMSVFFKFEENTTNKFQYSVKVKSFEQIEYKYGTSFSKTMNI